MLEGIEVLNKTEIMAVPEWVGTACMICAGLIVIGAIVSLIFIISDKIKFWIPVLFTIVSCLGFVVFEKLNDALTTEPTGKYEYQVTVDDSVTMNEFYDRYEIVEVNGKIYTIREKENTKQN